jgi:hypothetical protein
MTSIFTQSSTQTFTRDNRRAFVFHSFYILPQIYAEHESAILSDEEYCARFNDTFLPVLLTSAFVKHSNYDNMVDVHCWALKFCHIILCEIPTPGDIALMSAVVDFVMRGKPRDLDNNIQYMFQCSSKTLPLSRIINNAAEDFLLLRSTHTVEWKTNNWFFYGPTSVSSSWSRQNRM